MTKRGPTTREKPYRPDWTAENEGRLAVLWGDGLSASEIGAQLGMTRSAILGKAHRMKLPMRVQGVNKGAARRAAARKPRKPITPRLPKIRSPRVRAYFPKPPPMEVISDPPLCGAWEPIPGTTPVLLVELEAGMCRWPIGEGKPFLFCGCAVEEGTSYCAEHNRRSVGRGTVVERNAVRSAVRESSYEQFIPEEQAA